MSTPRTTSTSPAPSWCSRTRCSPSCRPSAQTAYRHRRTSSSTNEVPFFGWGSCPASAATAAASASTAASHRRSGPTSCPTLADTLVDHVTMDSGSYRPSFGYDAESGRTGVQRWSRRTRTRLRDRAHRCHHAGARRTDFTPWVEKIMTAADTHPHPAVAVITRSTTRAASPGRNARRLQGALMNFVGYIPGLLESSPQVADAIEGWYVNTQWLPRSRRPVHRPVRGRPRGGRPRTDDQLGGPRSVTGRPMSWSSCSRRSAPT